MLSLRDQQPLTLKSLERGRFNERRIFICGQELDRPIRLILMYARRLESIKFGDCSQGNAMIQEGDSFWNVLLFPFVGGPILIVILAGVMCLLYLVYLSIKIRKGPRFFRRRW